MERKFPSLKEGSSRPPRVESEIPPALPPDPDLQEAVKRARIAEAEESARLDAEMLAGHMARLLGKS